MTYSVCLGRIISKNNITQHSFMDEENIMSVLKCIKIRKNWWKGLNCVPFLSGRMTDTSVAPQLVTLIEKSPFFSSNNLISSFFFFFSWEPWTKPEAAKNRTHDNTKILVIVLWYQAFKETLRMVISGVWRENR